jgi:hypothetical protein
MLPYTGIELLFLCLIISSHGSSSLSVLFFPGLFN